MYALYKALDAYFIEADKDEAKLTKDLELLCQRTVAAVVDKCDVSANELCAQVWLCRADDGFERRAGFFLPDVRSRSGTQWRKGKGIAGAAWELDEDLFVDLGDLHEAMKAGSGDFERLDPSERYDMTFSEAANTSRYTGVCALRLISTADTPRLLGIFVIDYTGQGQFECVADAAESLSVSTYVGSCAEVLTDAEAKLPI